MGDYVHLRVSKEMKERLDTDQRDSETRNDQMERLLDGDSGAAVDVEQLRAELREVNEKLDRLPERVVGELPR